MILDNNTYMNSAAIFRNDVFEIDSTMTGFHISLSRVAKYTEVMIGGIAGNKYPILEIRLTMEVPINVSLK